MNKESIANNSEQNNEASPWDDLSEVGKDENALVRNAGEWAVPLGMDNERPTERPIGGELIQDNDEEARQDNLPEQTQE